MDTTRFKEIIDSYGTSVTRWPEAERDEALRVIVKDQDARRYTQAAAVLDESLDLVPAIEPSRAFLNRVVGLADSRPARASGLQGIRTIWPFGPIWRPAAGLAIALLLGLFAGTIVDPYGYVDLNAQEIDGEEVAALTFGPEFDLGTLE